ncbi:MAG: dimethylglycine dehydrogenase, partial [Hellea sp.]|nr:dimethylglycine dehydrogenase [Hellea sp.]
SYLVKKNEEAYADVFAIHYPDEERPAARPLRTSPCYDRMKERGAVFGQLFGWERPNWFAPEGIEQKDEWSFRRSSYYEHVGNECKNTAINAGLLDMTAFAKCRVQGPGALKFLNWIFAQRMPVAHGKLALCHGLTSKGGVHSEFTIQRESKDSFYMVSAGANHRLDHDWLKKHMPTDGSVQFTDLTNSMGVLVLAGPKSRDILQPITGANLSNECFPWLTGQETHVGYAPVKLLRVNFVGELGWEIHHPIEYQNHIFDSLFKHGDKHGLKPFGIRAMNSMRLEKSYRLVGTEMSIEYSAYESGLHRFVNLKKKNGFLGKDALLEWEKRGFDNAFVTLEVMDVNDADVIGNNPIYKNNEVVGRATSGGYGWRMNKSLALGMVHPDQSKVGNDLSIEILGKRYKCKVLNDSPHDPENEKLRS